MSNPTGAIGPTPGERELHQSWNDFLTSLAQVINLGQLLEPFHKNMLSPMDRAFNQLNAILSKSKSFSFRQHEQNIFVNNERLRCDGSTFLRHQQFLAILSARKIGGVLFRQSLSQAQWQEFVLAVARYNRESTTPYQDCAKQIEQRGLATVVDLIPAEGASGFTKAAKAVRLDRRAFAVRTYAKAMALLREYIRHLDDAKHRGYYHLKLGRVVQDLVTVCLDDSWKFIGVTNNKHYDDYLHNHSANVAILSLILGVKMGLRRAHLQELGMAALLHDLGKAFLPPELLRKATEFTELERTQLLRHPVLGVQALLRVRQYNESLLKRIMAICEHHEAVKGASLHVYSRVIAVAETFDALTSDRPHRKAFLPDAAVRMMVDMAGRRLDRDLVWLFVRTLGLLPCGTCVELSTGELAVVAHRAADPKFWMLPVVRIVRDAQGRTYRKPHVRDLSELPKGATEHTVHVVKAVDPAPLGINVAGYLYSDTSS